MVSAILGQLAAGRTRRRPRQTTLAALPESSEPADAQGAFANSGDSGFTNTFIDYCRHHHISAEVVTRINPKGFTALPKGWIVERTWSWLMNNRRLQVDYECNQWSPKASFGSPKSCLLMRRLVEPTSSD